MRNSKMMLRAELDRPSLPVFDAPRLAPAINDLAPPVRGRAVELADLPNVPLRAWSQLALSLIHI